MAVFGGRGGYTNVSEVTYGALMRNCEAKFSCYNSFFGRVP